MTRVMSWDGTRESFADEAAAFTWARKHLKSWMEPGDRLVRWTTAKGNTAMAVSVYGEPTDAHVLVGATS